MTTTQSEMIVFRTAVAVYGGIACVAGEALMQCILKCTVIFQEGSQNALLSGAGVVVFMRLKKRK